MPPVGGVVEISSDEEDLSNVGDDAIGADFDDLMILSDLSSPPMLQSTPMPDDLVIISEMSSQPVLETMAEPAGGSRDKEDDDCVILAGDPGKGEVEGSAGDVSPDELEILAAEGPIAYRDFPHSRHLCSNFPFSTTSHVNHCGKCHCFVCDAPAPCNYWADHCHATDKEKMWKNLRKSFRSISLPASCHPPIGNPSPLLNEVGQNQQGHPSVRTSLSVAGTVGTSRAGRGTGNAHIAQNTNSRAIFKRVGGDSSGLATTSAKPSGSAAAPDSYLVHQAMTHVSQLVQVAPTPRANAFPVTAPNNPPQGSFSAPLVSQARQAQQAPCCQVASNGKNVIGPQHSGSTSLITQRIESLPELRKRLDELLARIIADSPGLPDFSYRLSFSRHSKTNSAQVHPTASQGLVLQHESVAATENLTASHVHDLSNHTTGGNIQADGPIQTTENMHHLNHQSSLVPNEANLNNFATAPTDEISEEADRQDDASN